MGRGSSGSARRELGKRAGICAKRAGGVRKVCGRAQIARGVFGKRGACSGIARGARGVCGWVANLREFFGNSPGTLRGRVREALGPACGKYSESARGIRRDRRSRAESAMEPRTSESSRNACVVFVGSMRKARGARSDSARKCSGGGARSACSKCAGSSWILRRGRESSGSSRGLRKACGEFFGKCAGI